MSEIGDCLITRPNHGFEFGSWASAINSLELSERVNGRLVLINNSMFGPFQSMEELMESWSPSCEIFGITSSNEFRKHVQSYFMAFRPTVLKADFFKRYWNSDFHEEKKWSTIFRFEMRWADYFTLNGSQICIRHEAAKNFLRNPLTFRWFELVEEGMPFVKKSLFKQNYDRIDLHEWKRNLETINSDFPLSYIEKHINSPSN
jgi:lipopolysaccharide biosynthesis protein